MAARLRYLCITALLILLSRSSGAQVMFPLLEEDSTFDKRRISPIIYYSNPDRYYAGLRFRLAKGRLGDNAWGHDHYLQLRYSLQQNSFSLLYSGNFYELIGKWNLSVNTWYDWLVWTNFPGLGNETPEPDPKDYYRISTSEFAGNVGINRVINDRHYIDITAEAQGIEVLNKPNTLVSDYYLNDQQYYFEHHLYTSLGASYAYQAVDDHILPQRGVFFYAGGAYVVNTYQTEKSFAKYNAIAQFYIPLFWKFSLSVRGGGTGISGTPEFYQYVSVGGANSIRGFARDRFWGNLGYYNNNELRFITNMRVGKYTGKIGVFALFDDGRVWLDHENSDKIHYGYGGGLLISPMHRFTASGMYSMSEDGGHLQFRLTKLLNKMHASRLRQPN